MAKLPKRPPPQDGPWTVGRHGVPMPSSLGNRTPPPIDDNQTALPQDCSQETRPADSSQRTTADLTIGLEPLAGSVAESGKIQLAPDAGDSPDGRRGDWSVDATARSIPAPARTEPRNPMFRTVLLLLLLAVLSAVAYWTPATLETVAAATMELLLSTDIPQARTDQGPGPLVGQLDVTSTPSRVELFVDEERHGLTPAQLVLSTGAHDVTLVSPIGTVRRTVRVRPGQRTLFSEAIFNGSLVISSAVEVEVRIDGTVVGASAGHELALAPGSYQLELLNPDDGAHTEHTVVIFPGQVTTLDPNAPVGNN